MSYSRSKRLTGLTLILASIFGEGNALAKGKPGELDVLEYCGDNLTSIEKRQLCTITGEEQKRRGKVFGTNPQCSAKYNSDTTLALCLSPEDAQGFTAKGFNVTTHPWTDYATVPAEACPGQKQCTEIFKPAAPEAQPSYQCLDGGWRSHKAACPDVKTAEQREPVLTYVCPDNTPDISDDNIIVDDSSKCPKVEAPEAPEAVVRYSCADGTIVDKIEDCPKPLSEHEHASTILMRIETAQGYSGAEGRTGTLAGAVDVEAGAGIYLGGFVEVRGGNWFWRDASSSRKKTEGPQYIATESGENLIGSQSDLETLTERGIRASVGPELLYLLYEGTASVNAQARVGFTRQAVDSRTLETTNYWAQNQDGIVFQEGIPGPTGPAETASSSETRYGLEPSLGLAAWLPANGPLAVGVGVNVSYHHPFGKGYSTDNWGVDGLINFIYLLGGDERK